MLLTWENEVAKTNFTRVKWSTFEVKSTTSGLYPRIHVDTRDCRAVGQAGGVLLTRTMAVTGLGRLLSTALLPWRKLWAIHDPGKIVADLAISLVLGGLSG